MPPLSGIPQIRATPYSHGSLRDGVKPLSQTLTNLSLAGILDLSSGDGRQSPRKKSLILGVRVVSVPVSSESRKIPVGMRLTPNLVIAHHSPLPGAYSSRPPNFLSLPARIVFPALSAASLSAYQRRPSAYSAPSNAAHHGTPPTTGIDPSSATAIK